jgi:ABC-type phosphate/phosphonate transport system substrate-binding protein
MQAALPMYFPPPGAVQAFWTALAERLRLDVRCAGLDIPQTLQSAADVHAQWLEPDLLLSQACGYPLMTLLKDKVQLVGTLAYDAPGVEGIYCRSQLICRAGDARQALSDFAGSTLAFNDSISQSGYNALRALVALSTSQRPFFARSIQTGAHYRSIEAVRTGQADMASIDPVSWAHWLRSNAQHAAEVRVFEATASYPGLPLVTSLQTPRPVLEALRSGLQALATEPAAAAVRAPLLINGFVLTDRADYQLCLDWQEQAAAMGLQAL